MFGLPAAATSVGNQSRPEKMPFSTVPGLILPGQRTMHGTRKPPSHDRALGALERRHAAVRPGEHLGAVVGGEDDDGVVGLADVVEVLQDARRRCRPAAPCRPLPGRSWSCCSSSPGTSGDRNVQTCMRVVLCQTKNGLPSFLALSMKSHRRLDQHLVEGRHVVLGLRRDVVHVRHVGHVRERRQRALVHDLLLADLAPARHLGRVVRVGRPAVHQVARAVLVAEGLDRSGTSTSTGPTWRRGGTGSRRTRRSRAASAGTCSSRRGGSCRTGRWRSPAP